MRSYSRLSGTCGPKSTRLLWERTLHWDTQSRNIIYGIFCEPNNTVGRSNPGRGV